MHSDHKTTPTMKIGIKGLEVSSMDLRRAAARRLARDKGEGETGLVTDDTFGSLLYEWTKTAKKWVIEGPKAYAQTTKDSYLWAIDEIARPDVLGAIPVEAISSSDILAYFDVIADTPGKQATALAVIKLVEKWAVPRKKLPRQITFGITLEKSNAGHVPWSDEQIALAEANLPESLSRMVTLIANTGQRGSDIVRMGPTSIRRYDGHDGIELMQKKTGKRTRNRLWIPITEELAAAMDTWPNEPGPWVRSPETGGFWTRQQMAVSFRWYRDNLDVLSPLRLPPDPLPEADTKTYLDPLELDMGRDTGLVPHGLRGTACVRLRKAGCEEAEIAAMVGMSVPMVSRYCKQARQREMALAAVRRVGVGRTLGTSVERIEDIRSRAKNT